MLTKSQFMSYQRCPVELWLNRYEKHLVPPINAELQRRFDAGNQVDELARDLTPGGVVISGYNAEGWANTQKAISRGAKILYQPTAVTQELSARADILTQSEEPGTWDIREVKTKTKVVDEYITDLAFQKICFESAGIKIGKTYLVHINNQYVRKGEIDVEQLLTAEDVTVEVESVLEETKRQISEVAEYLEKHKDFSELLIQTCSTPHKCVILGACLSGHPEVYDMADKLPKEYLLILLKRGLLDPSKLSPLLLKKIGYEAPVPFHEIDIEQIKNELQQLKYPLYFYDYETYGHAIPPFDGMRPYQGIPFQYALFIQESKNSDLKFVEFLALEFVNPIPQLLAHLKKNIGPVGSVIVWFAGFESGMNREMAKFEPEYKEFLEDINSRMFDLMLIFKFKRQLYTHSDFEKSASLKMVLPVLFPELSHDLLAIQEGGEASASWPKLTDKELPESDKKKLAANMLEYCKRDSEAMVRILEHLYDKIETAKKL